MSLVGFKARNHTQQVNRRGADDDTDDRRTLAETFSPLNTEFSFTLDVAASGENAKCARYFTKEDDGLSQPWIDEVVWCNPPYSNLGGWCRKAVTETQSGGCPCVVMLLPANRCEQSWWQDYIEPHRDRGGVIETRFLRGRTRFGWSQSRELPKKGDRPPFGLVIVVIKGQSGMTNRPTDSTR